MEDSWRAREMNWNVGKAAEIPNKKTAKSYWDAYFFSKDQNHVREQPCDGWGKAKHSGDKNKLVCRLPWGGRRSVRCSKEESRGPVEARELERHIAMSLGNYIEELFLQWLDEVAKPISSWLTASPSNTRSPSWLQSQNLLVTQRRNLSSSGLCPVCFQNRPKFPGFPNTSLAN